MRQRCGLWAAAAVVLLACGSEDNGGNNPAGNNGFPAAGVGGTMAPVAGGGVVPGAAGATAGAAPAGAAPPAAGAAGVAPVAGATAGASGAPMAGGQEPVAGSGEAGTGAAGDDGAAGAAGDNGAAGAAGDDGAAGAAGGAAPTMGSCGPETTNSPVDLGDPDKLGPWTPMHVEGTGPTGASWVYYPDGLGMNGLKHPVFQWGPGAGTGPSNYLDHLNLLASHGFVIISQPSTQSGRQALDWILQQNETQGSMWYGKLDPDRVARGGHSMGALQSFSEADDPRLKFAVLVCGGANGGSGAANMSYPTIFLGGEGEGGTINFAGDYAQVTGLSVFVTKTSTDHIYCARNNLAPWVAFMRWQFCGEDRWKQEFMPGGTYCSSPWLDCMTKNF